MGAVAVSAAGHSIHFKVLVPPLLRRYSMNILYVLKGLGNCRVESISPIPTGNRFPFLVVEKPIPVLIVKLDTTRPERSGPETGDESKLPDIVRKPLHPFGELLLIDLKVHVIEA